MVRTPFVSLSVTILFGVAVAGIGARQPAPHVPLAPEKYKNIQVLTDVPADQLVMTMDYVAAATGRVCTDCHVQDASAVAGWAPERDDKPLKLRAREMMKMVKAINAGNFGVTVGCGTCHQGRNQPAGLQAMQSLTSEQGSTVPSGGGRSVAQAGPEAQGPPVDEVLSKYVEALGGRAAIEHLESRVMSGTVTTVQGRTLPVTIEQKGDRYREMSGADATQLVRGFDGTVAWMSSRGATVDLAVAEQALRLPDLALALHVKEWYPALQSAPPTRLVGRDVNVLRATAKGVTETLYFDAATGLLVRRGILTRTVLGSLPYQVDYADYRTVAGVKMPFQITRSASQAIDRLTVADIKPNVPLDDKRFGKP